MNLSRAKGAVSTLNHALLWGQGVIPTDSCRRWLELLREFSLVELLEAARLVRELRSKHADAEPRPNPGPGSDTVPDDSVIAAVWLAVVTDPVRDNGEPTVLVQLPECGPSRKPACLAFVTLTESDLAGGDGARTERGGAGHE